MDGFQQKMVRNAGSVNKHNTLRNEEAHDNRGIRRPRRTKHPRAASHSPP